MARLRYKPGLHLDKSFCPFCQAFRTAIVFRERYRWGLRLDCGHVRYPGLVLPPEELERRGIINKPTDDPRISRKEQMIRDGELEMKERELYEALVKLNSTRGRQYL